MELKKRWIALIVLLIGVTAALESSPRVVVLRTTLPPTSTCPCNDSPYGTSMLLRALERSGMNVTTVAGVAELEALDAKGYDSILLLVIAANGLDERYASRALDALASKGVPVYIAVIDEYPTQGEQELAALAGKKLCGAREPLVIARIVPTNPQATAVIQGVLPLQTGYTSYLSRQGEAAPVLVAPEPGPARYGNYSVVGWVWPSSGAYRDEWTPLAAECRGARGGVLLVADSSIFINEAFQSSRDYENASLALLRGLTGGGRVLVVVDEAMYLTVQARVAVAMHPSFFILGAARIYSSMESRVVSVLESRGLMGAAAALAGVMVLLFSWGSSQAASGTGEKKYRMPRVRPWVTGRGPGCAAIMERLSGLGVRRMIERIPDPDVREEARSLYALILEECGPRGVLGTLRRLLLGGREEEAYRAYLALLGLTGVSPLYESLGGEGER